LVGEAHLVLLGEASHSTGDLYPDTALREHVTAAMMRFPLPPHPAG
jgi:hypothetical protein